MNPWSGETPDRPRPGGGIGQERTVTMAYSSVYWVDVRNEPSVNLAEKLGFEVQAEELVVRVVR
jgi:hypothetical protein